MLQTLLQSLQQWFEFGGSIADDIEFHLPEEIIQRIQSFLDGKKAAQTTLVSTLWRSAWSTRPNLDFDERHFQTFQQFLEHADKTTQRYEDLNLNIETLKLHLSYDLFIREGRVKESHYCLSLAKELMAKALKLGASDLDITIWNRNFVLPDSVLRSETLARLSLTGSFKFDLKTLTYSKIKSLRLARVDIDMDGLSDRDEFPNLEYMYLYRSCTERLLVNDHSFFPRFSSLKELVLVDFSNLKKLRIWSTSIELITLVNSYYGDRMLSAEFDVPNIRRFKLEGFTWPRLAFKTMCREWEFDIRFECCNTNVDWYINLNKTLTEMSMSRVSLGIDINGERVIDCRGGLVGVVPVVVKKLTLKSWRLNKVFLDNLFSICHPKLIIWDENRFWKEPFDTYLFELVCKGIVEQVNVEVLEMASHEWRCVRLYNRAMIANVDDASRRAMFRNAFNSFRDGTFRYQLRW